MLKLIIISIILLVLSIIFINENNKYNSEVCRSAGGNIITNNLGDTVGCIK